MPSSFLNYRSITIDNTKVSGSSTNYPLAFLGTYSWLVFGSQLTDPRGYDVQFFSDAGLTAPLAWDRAFHNSTTGQVAYYVNVPLVTSASATTIYIAYNNLNVWTNQSNSGQVWDINHIGVYHFADISSINQSTIIDSTAYAQSGLYGWNTSGFTASVDTRGQAALFPSFGGGFITVPATVGTAPINEIATGSFSFEGWVSPSTGFSTTESVTRNIVQILSQVGTHHNNVWFEWLNGSNAPFNVNGCLSITIGGTDGSRAGATSAKRGTWLSGSHYYVAATYDASSKISMVFVNGVIDGKNTGQNRYTDVGMASQVSFGNNGSEYWSGSMAEMRISNKARPVEYYATQYANQNSPDTFYTIGAEQNTTYTVVSGSNAGQLFPVVVDPTLANVTEGVRPPNHGQLFPYFA